MKTVVIAACAAVLLAGCSLAQDSKSAVLSANVGPVGAGAGFALDGKIKAVPNATPTPAPLPAVPAAKNYTPTKEK